MAAAAIVGRAARCALGVAVDASVVADGLLECALKLPD